MANDKKILEDKTNSLASNVLGWLTFLIMAVSVVVLLFYLEWLGFSSLTSRISIRVEFLFMFPHISSPALDYSAALITCHFLSKQVSVNS